MTHADIGGQPGFGPIVNEPEDERFHAGWEPRVLAMTLAMGATGMWNIDISRAARESLPAYADLTYYEIWFEALIQLMRERGLIGDDEMAAGRSLRAAPVLPRKLHAADVPQVLAAGAPTGRPAATRARFKVGDTVRMHGGAVPHHTRLPRYVRGHRGVIERVHGAHVFADAHATGRGEMPHWLYTVSFDAQDLWPDAQRGVRVSVDAWEPYMKRA